MRAPGIHLEWAGGSQGCAPIVVAAARVRDVDVPRLADDAAPLRVAHAREEQQLHRRLQSQATQSWLRMAHSGFRLLFKVRALRNCTWRRYGSVAAPTFLR